MLIVVLLSVGNTSRQNRHDVLQRRQENGNWFINHAIMRHYVFIDECGYNIWTARNHGRERQGMCAYRQVTVRPARMGRDRGPSGIAR